MLTSPSTRREIEQRAERLIRKHGEGAYSEARRREREASDLSSADRWRRVALTVARRTGKRIGIDTAALGRGYED